MSMVDGSQELDQVNIGSHQRCAGRDYLENNYYGDPAAFMKLATAAEIDRQAVENEIFFRKRFRFTAPSEQRAQFIAFKNNWDFTDSELVQLRRTGCLALRKGSTAKLTASYVLIIFGCVLSVSPTLYGLLSSILLLFADGPFTWQQRLGQTGVLAASMILFFWADYCSFSPLRILLRRGLKLGQTVTLP